MSKAWNATIHDQQFIKAHLQSSITTNSARTILVKSFDKGKLFSVPFNNEETFGAAVKIKLPFQHPHLADMLGYSVHGLACICRGDDIALWNSSITFELEQSSGSEEMKLWGAYYGFGYDSTKDYYKIVGLTEFF